jgi:23S rRNA G2069 N7-methylase RlmK/C1962 C5-methylase RlmI
LNKGAGAAAESGHPWAFGTESGMKPEYRQMRAHEGLSEQVEWLFVTAGAEDGGVRFPVDPLAGQITGWFPDKRPNRDGRPRWLPARG